MTDYSPNSSRLQQILILKRLLGISTHSSFFFLGFFGRFMSGSPKCRLRCLPCHSAISLTLRMTAQFPCSVLSGIFIIGGQNCAHLISEYMFTAEFFVFLLRPMQTPHPTHPVVTTSRTSPPTFPGSYGHHPPHKLVTD